MAYSPGDAVAGAEPTLTVAAVARLLGVAPATLRTWDRRYGVGPTEHLDGTYRRYTRADVSKLTMMRRLMNTGVTPAEAARIVRTVPRHLGEELDQASLAAVLPGWGRRGPPARTGGGRVIRLPGATASSRGLARAAQALDAASCTEIIQVNVAEHGLVGTWDGLLVPVLVAVGERWQSTQRGIDVEHLLCECVLHCLQVAVFESDAREPAAPVLLTCAEDEQHSLPIHVLAAVLAERGVATRVLGGRVPPDALAAAVRLIGPSVLFVWSSLKSTGHAEQLDALPGQRPEVRVILGGPGWDTGIPPWVVTVTTLSAAVDEVILGVQGLAP